METVELVIRVPENLYKTYRALMLNGDAGLSATAKLIAYATPLPKGHGNLYDENDIKEKIKNPYQCQTVLYGLKQVNPVIEADKEG